MRAGVRSLANTGVLLVCLLLTTAVLLPAIAQQRSLSRASACAMNLKKIGLAIHNYHSAYKRMPAGCGGSSSGESLEKSNQGRLGSLVALLPFISEQKLWEAISNPYTNTESGQQFPKMGPVPWYNANAYKPWSQAPLGYSCPDRPGQKPVVKEKIVYTLDSKAGVFGLMTNYVACYGDGTFNVGVPYDETQASSLHARSTNRGAFQTGEPLKFRDFLDGLSNTILYSETRSSVRSEADSAITKNVVGLSKNPSLCLAAAKAPQVKWWPFGRGARWCDGELALTGFQTVLPPNSPSCTSENGIHDAIASASSYHSGGVHVLLADGAVVFITDSIDAGDPTAPGVSNAEGYGRPGTESPYGLWGALGTRAMKETIESVGVKPMAATSDTTTDNKRGTPAGDFRGWTSKDGSVSLNARLLRIIDKKTIELEDTSGVVHQVPLNSLSDSDMFLAVTSELMKKEGIDN